MDRDIYPGVHNRMHGLAQKEAPGLIPPIGGVIEAFYKEDGHYRFVGKTDGDIAISVDVEGGEMLVDVGGLILQVRGERAEIGDNRFAVYNRRNGVYAEFDIEPGSRFRLKLGLRRR